MQTPIPANLVPVVTKLIELAAKHPASVSAIGEIVESLFTSDDPAEKARRIAMAAAAEEFIQS